MVDILMGITGFCVLLVFGVVLVGLMYAIPYCLVQSFRMFKEEKNLIDLGFFAVFFLLAASFVCSMLAFFISLFGEFRGL